MVELQNLPQSYFVISDFGYHFQPEQDVEWRNDMFLSSFEECLRRCNEDHFCRTLDYDYNPNWCRLFELEPSPDEIVYDSTSNSRVVYVELFPTLYSNFNQTCDYCVQDRYFSCIGGTCQCPYRTYWNGLTCPKQKYAGSLCASNKECRTDNYNLSCVSADICTSTGYSTNICAINRTSVLFNYTTNQSQSYALHSSIFMAATTSIMVTFSLEDWQAFWLLDDISLMEVDSSTELIENGDFNMGSLTSWNYCNPTSTNNSSQLYSNGSGQYYYSGSPRPKPDFLSQRVPTTIGAAYQLSFSLGHTANTSNNSFLVTIFS